LEMYEEYIPEGLLVPKAPILVLAGDIAHPHQEHFIKWVKTELCSNFKAVIYLTGNHEYYNSWTAEKKVTIEEVDEQCRKLASEIDNFYFLDNSSILIGNYRLAGGCMWSNVPKKAKDQVFAGLNDYYRCFESAEKELQVETTNKMHAKAVAYLEQILTISEKKKEVLVFLTHHTPSLTGTSDPKYETPDNMIQFAFSTDLKHMMKPPLALWCFGHTHFNSVQEVNNVTLVSNQRGYPFENSDMRRKSEWNDQCVVTVKPDRSVIVNKPEEGLQKLPTDDD